MCDPEYRKAIFEKKENVIFDKPALLYIGLGIGAKFSYKFNTIREKFPNLFKSRMGNKFVYSQMGAFETFDFISTKLNIREVLEVYPLNSNSPIEVPDCENLVF